MAKQKRLLSYLFSFYVLIILLSILAVGWALSTSFKKSLFKEVETDLKERSLLLGKQIVRLLVPLDERSIDDVCKSTGHMVRTRFTVVLPSGKVAGDSEEDPSRMDNHLDRPEIVAALGNGPGVSERHSLTIGSKFLYVAVPIKEDGRILAVVRTSIPMDFIGETMKGVHFKIALGGLMIMVITVLLSFLISRRIMRPIEEIKRGAESFAKGNFQYRSPVSDLQEIAGLSNAVNRMASELQQRINSITQNRNELKAVLSGMLEGVLAVDLEERIISMNQAAAQIFNCDLPDVQGRSIQEVLRHTELQRFVTDALSGEDSLEKDIVLMSDGEIILSSLGTPLLDGEGKRVGSLIVLNDVTRLRKLENIRRDFVANVSHEIKTPITTIRGFVETLKDGAAQNPDDAARFLSIIQKHVERLEAIVDDLLKLSRIEKETEREEIAFEEQSIQEVLAGAIQVCDVKASAKDIFLEISCPEDLKGRINPALLEQAVVNLIDNAIKYSDPGKPVRIEAHKQAQEIVIRVQDQGCGIEREHLDRLFERFYRVDRARSRRLGGTGLGLSIVKHIAEAHGGRVSVESTLGEGSVFFIHLPV